MIALYFQNTTQKNRSSTNINRQTSARGSCAEKDQVTPAVATRERCRTTGDVKEQDVRNCFSLRSNSEGGIFLND